jgi:TonB family protein
MSARGRATLRRVPPFLGLSLLGHLLIVAILMVTGALHSCLAVVDEPPDELHIVELSDEPIDVTMIEAKPLNPFAAPLDEEEQAKAMETKLEEARKEETDMNGQVVDIAKPQVEMRPEDADFLSEFDSKVERETRGPSGVDPASARNPSARPAVPDEPSRPVAPRPPVEGNKGNGALSMRGAGEGAGGDDHPATPGGVREGFDPTGAEGILPRRGEGVGVDGHEKDKGGAGEAGEPGEGESLPNLGDLRPSEDVVRDVVGAGSSDYLKDIDDGEQTLLNTKRFKYATFFNRVKKAVAQNWHPDTAYRLRDPTGQIYGQKNRLTVLKVSIHPDGHIRDILIEKPSGVDFLDDEAVSAFEAAEPFPNPPGGLVDPDSHLITFRFGFFFEITSAPSFKIFRYGN